MQRTVILLAACAVAGCVASSGSRSTASAPPLPPEAPGADSVPRAHAEVDLTGTWATGSTAEPSAERIVLHVPCNYTPPLWILEQSGDTVRAWAMPARQAQGIATHQSVSTTPIEGRVSGMLLTMGPIGARYVVRYDPTSGHLRGTLNGAPFWAARQELVRPDHCLPVP